MTTATAQAITQIAQTDVSNLGALVTELAPRLRGPALADNTNGVFYIGDSARYRHQPAVLLQGNTLRQVQSCVASLSDVLSQPRHFLAKTDLGAPTAAVRNLFTWDTSLTSRLAHQLQSYESQAGQANAVASQQLRLWHRDYAGLIPAARSDLIPPQLIRTSHTVVAGMAEQLQFRNAMRGAAIAAMAVPAGERFDAFTAGAQRLLAADRLAPWQSMMAAKPLDPVKSTGATVANLNTISATETWRPTHLTNSVMEMTETTGLLRSLSRPRGPLEEYRGRYLDPFRLELKREHWIQGFKHRLDRVEFAESPERLRPLIEEARAVVKQAEKAQQTYKLEAQKMLDQHRVGIQVGRDAIRAFSGSLRVIPEDKFSELSRQFLEADKRLSKALEALARHQHRLSGAALYASSFPEAVRLNVFLECAEASPPAKTRPASSRPAELQMRQGALAVELPGVEAVAPSQGVTHVVKGGFVGASHFIAAEYLSTALLGLWSLVTSHDNSSTTQSHWAHFENPFNVLKNFGALFVGSTAGQAILSAMKYSPHSFAGMALVNGMALGSAQLFETGTFSFKNTLAGLGMLTVLNNLAGLFVHSVLKRNPFSTLTQIATSTLVFMALKQIDQKVMPHLMPTESPTAII